MEFIRSVLCLNPKKRRSAKRLLAEDFLSLNLPSSIEYIAPKIEESRKIRENFLSYNEDIWADSYGLKSII